MGLKRLFPPQGEGPGCVLDLPAPSHTPDVCHIIVSMTGTPRIVQCTACAAVCGDPGPGFFPRRKVTPISIKSVASRQSSPAGFGCQGPSYTSPKGGGP